MNSFLGIAIILFIAYLFSSNRKQIRWRTVGGAFAIQLALGAFVLYVPFGQDVLYAVASGVANIIAFTDAGIDFMFGGLASADFGFVFAIRVLSVIVFFSSLISVLYYVGIMKWIIKILGGSLQKIIGSSRPESMSAAANVFVGQTEAPMMVRPFIASMTKSELFAVMVGGMASVSGSVLAGYAGVGVELKYLIAASFMAAPAGLLMAKMIIPETEKPREDLDSIIEGADIECADDEVEQRSVNVIDAAAAGASSGVQLAINVGAMLIAFVALIALINGLFGWVGGWFGYPELSLQLIFGYVFQPVAYILGVSWDEAQLAGSFIGQKLVINEFVAYLDFVNYQDQLSEHSQVIITFVLCGFANFSSIAILLGGLGGMAPSRRHDIARLGMKALLAATLANMMSAAIAGFFFTLGAA
ncbi:MULTISPECIES: NupC/NupG family nucleoside CNT transporter [Idiomarinaceae]|uniref:Nucleoside permease n=2 Tax=Pseudidiomarina TaxID=2800384 RepID=A0AB39X7S3_9GAMM|nr:MULTISPECIES: NupC/NupG family nucleoside CNT transporter [Idiomarinaceae]MDX1525371.1 NupC/NupG family nucleoside CNT transporter [Pseudidiomarina maritima]MDT7524646.1 NupC/NupG family nucleoside CNT transporter [Pseudidiomarina sp. GXY010]MRJ41336.1 NupC/NupG family nucleoside CNT transporter [Idiomarina sp. FeN1]NCU56811.1 NupC/NupG family nucleoside CNT transporter [Idiomarina sp. FenA--70]NCU59520.1 NupC/NupG family nucleoside CNT transporter [Idiomarina sp. FenBw--71]